VSPRNAFSRRQALQLMGAAPPFAAMWTSAALAQSTAQSPLLPLQTSGLEHIGMTVPDQEASAKFYGMIFDPQLFQERDAPPRFYCRLGTAYAAFGGGAANTPAKIDHFCALVKDYKPQEMRKALEEAGVPMGQGPQGMATDPDGMRLQLLGVPGGLARTIIPNRRISQDDPALQAIGLEHIMLLVSDLDKSAAHYRKFFGMELSRTKSPARIWFGAAKTRLGLELAGVGKMPQVDHICLRVAGFDRKSASEKIKKLGAEILPSNDEQLLRFKDPNGFVMELKAG
jgi:catechol 2,3-dioxygenase-like lactoylglutathione lyase family enzyme